MKPLKYTMIVEVPLGRAFLRHVILALAFFFAKYKTVEKNIDIVILQLVVPNGVDDMSSDSVNRTQKGGRGN